MKARIRIPTTEYAFIELETDLADDMSHRDIVEMHDFYQNLVKDKEGLNQLEWAKVRNNFILNNIIDEEDYNKLSKAQRYVINEVKLATRSVTKE